MLGSGLLSLAKLPGDLLSESVKSSEERTPLDFLAQNPAHSTDRLAVQKFDRVRDEIGVHQGTRRRRGLGNALELGYEQRVVFRQWPELHCQLHDDPESAKGPNVKLGEVIPRNVLDHLAAP